MEMKLKITAISKNKWGDPPSSIKTDQLLTEYQCENGLAIIVWARNPSTDIKIGKVGDTIDILQPINYYIGDCNIDIGQPSPADKPSGSICSHYALLKLKERVSSAIANVLQTKQTTHVYMGTLESTLYQMVPIVVEHFKKMAENMNCRLIFSDDAGMRISPNLD